jgi:catechol 2,3-dioxygenase-like lactoylglutathione lyase family enzyme
MVDHLTLPVTDYERAKAFYLAALGPLGYGVVMELSRDQIRDLDVARACGIGPGHKPILWLKPGESVTPTHVAFRVDRRSLVDEFHRAALDAGGTDHGAPGLRPHYHPGYYGAFVLDPDGYNIEVVCHGEGA